MLFTDFILHINFGTFPRFGTDETEENMQNKDNQNQQYRIYIKESKSWVDVNKEFYTNYYRGINAYLQTSASAWPLWVRPVRKRYLCDMDCLTCPYAKAGDQLSLDNTVERR